MDSADLVVNRWRRYGKDRLYVTRADGTPVGWWDLVADDGHPETAADAEALAESVSAWRSAGAVSRTSERVLAASAPQPPTTTSEVRGSAAPDPATATVERPWLDLALNTPGMEVRQQADAAREAAPVRTLLARALRVHTDERAWRIGAEGEERVAAELDKVVRKDPRWRVLHAVPVGTRGSDIDHVVIGPGGVFTLNAKHHPRASVWVAGDTVQVNGSKRPYVRNARHEAERAARLLAEACGFPVHVDGVVAIVKADRFQVRRPPIGVQVLRHRELARWIRRHGDIHSPERVQAVFDAARRSTTWQP